MTHERPTHALPILFDLASTLAVPRISKYIRKLMWPVMNTGEAAEFESLSRTISKSRIFECDYERWPFHSGADKVVAVARTMAAVQAGEDECRDHTFCYATEYYLELIFQRFFAWVVYHAATDAERANRDTAAHFHYRNAYANARAVLAMPLLVDLSRKGDVTVGQGNFGYKPPSREQPWVYPHLSHYLSAFYYPWLPNVGMPRASSGSALARAIARSAAVAHELFERLRDGESLRQMGENENLTTLTLEQLVPETFGGNTGDFISPFVLSAITRIDIRQFFAKAQELNSVSREVEAELFVDEFTTGRVDAYVDPGGREGSKGLYEEFLQTCRKGIESALHREFKDEGDGHGLSCFDNAELKLFLKWRFLEERLRLIVDRLLLQRRFYDPPLTRTRFSSKFENLGIFAVEVPEIHFNLQVEDFNGADTSVASSCPEPTDRRRQYEDWLKAARECAGNKEKLWEQGKFPYHALFETYLLRKEGAREFDAFWMSLLVSHIVPSVSPDARKKKQNLCNFIRSLKKEWGRELSEVRPFGPLAGILRQKEVKETEAGDDRESYEEDHDLWKWLEHKLSRLLAAAGLPSCAEVTLEQVLTNILHKSPEWEKSLPAPRRRSWRGTLDEAAGKDAENEEKEREDRGRLFFSYDAFFGINTSIFRAFTDRNFARNFVTVRLIATERAFTRAATSVEEQDHADFVGTYVVWDTDANGNPIVEGADGAFRPRLDAWREDRLTSMRRTSRSPAYNWLSDLHTQKLLIKNLGVSLLNTERIREQERFLAERERLNELVKHETERSTIAGIMARNMSHNIGSHVLASSGLLFGIHRNEIQKLHNFLQQRMDFIAQVVTYTPSWGEPTFFFKDLLRGFFDQFLLLDNLIKDQGYEDITFYVRPPGGGEEYVFVSKTVFKCERCDKSVWGEDEGEPCTCDKQARGGDGNRQQQGRRTGSWVLKDDLSGAAELPDFLVAIPGGAIGAHAFYVIIENILRNSAKYGIQQPKKDGLKMHIEVEECDEYYRIVVWDNTGNRHEPSPHIGGDGCGCRVCILQQRLRDELIDPSTGVVTEKSRGIHEMKQCAGILVNPHLKDFGVRPDGAGGRRYALWAEGERYNGNGVGHGREAIAGAEQPAAAEYLAYHFVLQKPRLVGVVCPDSAGSPAAKSAGVFHYPHIKSLSKYPHQFGLVFLNDDTREKTLDYIEKHHHLLPYRLLVVGKTDEAARRDIPPRRLHLLDDVRLPEGGADAAVWQEFTTELYELWLRKFKEGEGQEKWKLLISFERQKEHLAFARWKKALLENFKSELVEVYLTRASKEAGIEEVVYSPSGATRFELVRMLNASPSSWVVYDNHRTALRVLRGGQVRSYNDFGLKNLRLYQALESPPTTRAGVRFFILGLLEAALTNIVIVDERVADAVYSREEGFLSDEMQKLMDAKCYTVFSVWAQKDTETKLTRKFVSETIEQRSLEFADKTANIHDEEGLRLSPDDPQALVHVPSNPGAYPQRLPADTIDTIVIHQGVIDILERSDLWKGKGHGDEHLKILYRLSPSVVITSGRGRTIRHIGQEEIPFIEFSIVKDNTYTGLSKYHLVRAILSVAGEKKRDGQQ